MAGIVFFKVKGYVWVLFYMIAESYLLLTYVPVVLQTSLTFGLTAGIYKEFDILFARQVFKDIKFVVEVVIRDYYVIILFKLGSQSLFGVKALAGGAGKLVLWKLPADIVLKERRRYYHLVHAVVGEMKHHIAALIAEVLFFEHDIRKCEAKGNTAAVEFLYYCFHVVLVGVSALRSSAVPQAGRENSVKRGNFHSLTEEFGVVFQHFRKQQVKLEAA